MGAQPLAQIQVAKKTREQIETEMQGVSAPHPDSPLSKVGRTVSADVPTRRSERIGKAWRVRDDALWNPFEVAGFLGAIIFAFGFLMGRDHFFFAFELFIPVIVVAAVVVVGQAVLRRKAGEVGALTLLRQRLR